MAGHGFAKPFLQGYHQSCLDGIATLLIHGELQVLLDAKAWENRETAKVPVNLRDENKFGLGRELFGALRKNVTSAEEGAISWLD